MMMLSCHVGFRHPNDDCDNFLCDHHVVVVVFSCVAASLAFHILEEYSDVICFLDELKVFNCAVHQLSSHFYDTLQCK